jgi:outer membrane protein TolC
MRAGAIADAQLPDPTVRFGVANLATDTFRFNQEQMTQLQLGVHQSFPTIGKRKLKRAYGEANSDAVRFMASSQELILKLEVERIWLKLHHTQITADIVRSKRARLDEKLEALGAKFESGEADAQKILTMEAELALIDDRLEALEQASQQARVQLARYIGSENANKPLAGGYNDIAAPRALVLLEQEISDHPALMQERAFVRANDHSVALAKENYRPNWGVDLGYGYRAAGRADFATAMVTFDVPLFTAKRQDKRLLAAKQSKQAAQLKLQAKELDIIRDIRAAYIVWQKSTDRIALYETVVMARTQSAVEASENAYATGSADFAEIIRTHISELDARLKLEAIKLERALAQIQLKYYEGASS